ncbi:concanavalin A-like lectin/glucanase domain-containing protein [Syncephalis plumigaleata]|nr:concanavalin A-like lectin/glucanase domain-containing protein [Syncephalis plumigaleata]
MVKLTWTIAAAASILLASSLTQVNAICKNFGSKCSEDSPCCLNGYCDSKPNFCAAGCDPENSFSPNSCYPKPACVNFETNFDNPKELVAAANYDGNPNNFDWTSDFEPNYASIGGSGLQLDMKYQGDKKNDAGNYGGFGATVTWTRYMQYGKATVVMKSASMSPGVVSSFITKSPEGDEIDFEWVGKDPTEVQSNYYYNNELDYTKGGHHNVGVDTSKEFREYAIEWMPDYVTWWVDGKPVRTASRNSTERMANGTYKFPNKMSNVGFSIWDGGMGLKGTADWAGTPTNWSDKSKIYSLYVKSLKIECLYPNATGNWPPAGYGPKPKGKANPDGPYVPSEDDGGSFASTFTAPIALWQVCALTTF